MQLNPRMWLFGLAFGFILAGVTVNLVDTWGTFGHALGPWVIGFIVLLAVLSITFLSLSLLARKMIPKDVEATLREKDKMKL
jgi:hypothetical protein